MYYHNKVIKLTCFLSFLFINSCAITYAPTDWLPDTKDVASETYGGWITVTALSANEKVFEYSGEFIAVDENNVYLLYDSVYIISKTDIQKSVLEIDEKNSIEYGLWALGGTLSTISNGKFLVITAPLWLLGGIPSAAGESYRDYYEAEYPDSVYWESVSKFARFPQGLPDGVHYNELKAKVILKN
ncbi:MAG: hypothetical protein MUO34_13135 [Ignavibacteriaceae bacterium]|nr:hypothetical protein [Ignavibacteriaceae bacterium]